MTETACLGTMPGYLEAMARLRPGEAFGCSCAACAPGRAWRWEDDDGPEQQRDGDSAQAVADAQQ